MEIKLNSNINKSEIKKIIRADASTLVKGLSLIAIFILGLFIAVGIIYNAPFERYVGILKIWLSLLIVFALIVGCVMSYKITLYTEYLVFRRIFHKTIRIYYKDILKIDHRVVTTSQGSYPAIRITTKIGTDLIPHDPFRNEANEIISYIQKMKEEK